MFLKQISLLHFKNYPELSVSFHSKINCFTGANGMGKTNLLDAIYHLSFGKSSFNTLDSQNISFNEEFFMIQGLYEKDGRDEEVMLSIKRGQKKILKRNKNEYEKLSDHIGQFPLVMISPQDSSLISGGSDQRRRFIDSIISQFDKNYLENLIRYSAVLEQRNALLKQFALARSFDSALIEILDIQLAGYGTYIHEARGKFLLDFIPVFETNYQFLSDGKEEIGLTYISSLRDKDYIDALKQAVHKDCAVEHTTVGIHRDDLEFLIRGHDVKKYASQGQQKTWLLALKLAQYAYVKQKTGIKPLLLLDDIYDKLDGNRFNQLVELVSSQEFGQIFITDTHRDRMELLFRSKEENSRIFLVKNAELTLSRKEKQPGQVQEIASPSKKAGSK